MKNFDITDEYDLFASQGQRFLNFVIDYIVRLCIIMILAIIFGLICVILGFDELIDSMDNIGRLEEIVIGLVSLFLYYVILKSYFSRTIGKYITGTIVVKIDGSKPKTIDILARTLLRIVPFEYFTFLRGRQPGWHDEYSKTFVVVKAKLESSKNEFLEFQNF